MKTHPFLLLLLALACGLIPGARAEKLTIAAAANLTYALEPLNTAYRQANPGDEIVALFGASGSLFAQITNGAPIDVFLSADLDYPQKLVKAGAADAGTLTTFATGRLVFWTMRPDLTLPDLATALRDPGVRHVAIANPKTAPYGRAAKETMVALKLWDETAAKFVIGENITQTAQFVETGNAEAGFVALSLVLSSKLKDKGRYLEVPAALHAPLDQGAVVTSRGSTNPAAARYLDFLKSRAAREILTQYGYAVPVQ